MPKERDLSSENDAMRMGKTAFVLLLLGAVATGALLVWQGLTGAGNPNPAAQHIGSGAAVLDTAVLVFREGLETILVLAALTASMVGTNGALRRPIATGAGFGLIATLLTWVGAVAILDVIEQSAPVLAVQALTGILAIIVLIVVMNWFFHKFYWTGWISMHNQRKRSLMERAKSGEVTTSRLVLGLALLGFASIYREGFEVVLFLQGLRLQVGSAVVGEGVLGGLAATSVVGCLTFAAHRRLPYKRMLVLTGLLLTVVLLVMVGEEVQEMQLAGWLGDTPIGLSIPSWVGLWFSVFPNVETIVAQILAAVAVLGSFMLARYLKVWRHRTKGTAGASPPGSSARRASRTRQTSRPATDISNS